MADPHPPGLNEEGELEGSSGRHGGILRQFWDSTIGKKIVVAVSGSILGLYLIVHMLGNLKGFQGPGGGEPEIDVYGEWLREVGSPALPEQGALWVVRAILLLALVLHVVAIVQLSRRNLAAKPKGHRPPRIQRSLASRTMLLSGLVLLAFVVFHVLQFTTATIQTTPIVEGEVYANLYAAFQEWYFVVFYVVSMGLLALHLRHGAWSLTQTMGWDKPNRNPTLRRTATALAVVVSLGFAAVPLGFWLGIVPEPTSEAAATAASGEPR
ncbi:MAG: succinate dehydrogenase cytochrome b subunit [Solirubrobacterales bacterium]|nr:succinate dehydrogenase cytochrome b subunit [Solirubrobacterales bacterium]